MLPFDPIFFIKFSLSISFWLSRSFSSFSPLFFGAAGGFSAPSAYLMESFLDAKDAFTNPFTFDSMARRESCYYLAFRPRLNENPLFGFLVDARFPTPDELLQQVYGFCAQPSRSCSRADNLKRDWRLLLSGRALEF